MVTLLPSVNTWQTVKQVTQILSQETFLQSCQSYGNQIFKQGLPEILFACFNVFLRILFPLIFTADTNTSEMLVTMGSVQLEEFYPAVAVSALMRIVRDSSLSSHHTMVIQVCLLPMMLSGMVAIFYGSTLLLSQWTTTTTFICTTKK